jgi:hypothetical protein
VSKTGPPYHHARHVSLLRAGLLAATLVVAAGACTSDDPPPQAGTTSTARPSSTTSTTSTAPPSTGGSVTTSTPTDPPSSTTDTSVPAEPAHQAIIDAYLAYWDARLAANTGTPNPQDPALAAHATGPQLDAVVAETQKNLDEGIAFQVAANPANFRRVTVVSVNGDEAEVQECLVDDFVIVDRNTGSVINDTVASQSVIGTLQLVDGAWRVSSSRLVQRWEGVAGCALAS